MNVIVRFDLHAFRSPLDGSRHNLFDARNDLWGDTVNLASRMETGGVPDAIQVTRPVYEALKDEFTFEFRGAIEVKGKGKIEAWLMKL